MSLEYDPAVFKHKIADWVRDEMEVLERRSEVEDPLSSSLPFVDFVSLHGKLVAEYNWYGFALNERKSPSHCIVPTCYSGFLVGLPKLLFNVYSHCHPKVARLLSEELVVQLGARIIKYKSWAKLGKALTSVCKQIQGDRWLLGSGELTLAETTYLTDLGRWVGYTASEATQEEVNEMAYKWCLHNFKTPAWYDNQIPECLNLYYNVPDFKPKIVEGPTWANLMDYLPELMTSGSAGPGETTLLTPDGKKLPKTKANAVATWKETDLEVRLRKFIARPTAVVKIFIKPDELGKTRTICSVDMDSTAAQSVWLSVTMRVLRGSPRSPLFHDTTADIAFTRQIVEVWQGKRCIALPMDEGEFDKRKSATQIMAMLRLTTQWVARNVTNPELYIQLGDAIVNSLINTRVYANDVYRGMWNCGIMSGWKITAFIDTICSGITAIMLLPKSSRLLWLQTQGDDTDTAVTSVPEAERTMAAYRKAGFDVNAQKQSLGIPATRPITEFLRRVIGFTDLSAGQTDSIKAPGTRPKMLSVWATSDQLAALPKRAQAVVASLFTAVGYDEERRKDIHIFVCPTDPQIEGLEQLKPDDLDFASDCKASDATVLQAITMYGDQPIVNVPTLYYMTPPKAFVCGYLTRAIPGVFLRKPGRPEQEEWDLRISAVAKDWIRLINRGANIGFCIEMLVLNLAGATKVGNKQLICDWLCTETVYGGFGIYPFSPRKVGLLHPHTKARYRARGYAGLLNAREYTLGLAPGAARQFVDKRVTGIPLDVDEADLALITARRIFDVQTALHKPVWRTPPPDDPGYEIMAFPDNFTALDAEILKDQLESARDEATINALMDKLMFGNQLYQELVARKVGVFIRKAWVLGTLPFTAFVALGWAERLVSSLYAVRAKQAWKLAVTTTHNLSMRHIMAAALKAADWTLEDINRLDIIFRE